MLSMTNVLLLVASLLAATCLLAQSATAAEPRTDPPFTKGDRPGEKVLPDTYGRWSIVGDWRVTHPDWTGVLTLRPDGTLINTQQDTGRWVLTSERGTPLLVIRWDLYGTTSVTMVTPNHFRGQQRTGRWSDLRRGSEAAAPRPDDTSAKPR